MAIRARKRAEAHSWMIAIAFLLSWLPAANATNHIQQLDEVMAGCNSDPSVQFVEIKMGFGGQNLWGPQAGETTSRVRLVFFDSSGAETGEFDFPGNPPSGQLSVLMATPSFASLPGAPTPDFTIPAGIMAPAGQVCFTGNSNNPNTFDVNLCLSYGDFTGPMQTDECGEPIGSPAPALPVSEATSLQRVANFGNFGCGQFNADFALRAPAPTNSAGATGVVAVSDGACQVTAPPPPPTPVCPETDLGSPPTVSVSGSTAGKANSVGGASCGGGGNNAPDATFLYTAPLAGNYQMTTAGSFFDTILYVRNGTCSGTQLACNDDSNGTLQSRVVVTLAAGQSVVVVVDGFGTASGSFDLAIARLTCGDGILDPGEQCDAGSANGTTTCGCTTTCQFPPAGRSCSDGNFCTLTDQCSGSGQCFGSNSVVCSAVDQCHDAGTCNPATGVCSNPTKPNGTGCTDGNRCTQTDQCTGSGQCVGSSPVVCSALDQCHTAGTCNSATGVCSNPNRPNGSTCSDGDPCTAPDQCSAGKCTSGGPVALTGDVTGVQQCVQSKLPH